MKKAGAIQLHAALLILLLFGGEAARIHQGVETLGVAQKLSKAHALFKLGTGSPVCKAETMTDPVETMNRYTSKCAKLEALSEKIVEANCVASCPTWIVQLRTRLTEFKSCINMATGPKAGSMPSELQALVTGSTGQSLSATMGKVQANMMLLMKQNGHFPAKGDCDFNLSRFNASQALASSADHMRAVRGQIFGERCASEQDVQAYTDSLSRGDAKAIGDVMKNVRATLEIHKSAMESDKAPQDEIAEIMKSLDEADASFLEKVSGDGSSFLEDGEGLEPVFIFLIVVGALIVTWLVWVMIAECAGLTRPR